MFWITTKFDILGVCGTFAMVSLCVNQKDKKEKVDYKLIYCTCTCKLCTVANLQMN